jgi:hypothetical protein
MRKILFILAILLLFWAVDAREPKVGDLVNVVAGNAEYDGKITGISNGLMCMDARLYERTDGWGCTHKCFGIGQIERLSWINDSIVVEKQ